MIECQFQITIADEDIKINGTGEKLIKIDFVVTINVAVFQAVVQSLAIFNLV